MIMTDDKIKLIFEKCTPDKANDKKLPSDSYVVSYEEDKELKYDIIRAAAQVDVFDTYYDKYKNVLSIVQSLGKVPPKLWKDPNQKETPKGKKKR